MRVGTVQVRMGTLRFILLLYFYRCLKVLVKKTERAREKEKERKSAPANPIQESPWKLPNEALLRAVGAPPPCTLWSRTADTYNGSEPSSTSVSFVLSIRDSFSYYDSDMLLWKQNNSVNSSARRFFYFNLQVMAGVLLTFYKMLISFIF